MPVISIEDAIKDVRAGRMVILVDDEDRENEGDLMMAAEKITPESVNFMATYGRGLICLAMTGKKIEGVSNQSVLLDVDGEQPGELPVIIDIIPNAISVITA